VVILVSDKIPAYQQVADEVAKRIPNRSSVLYLSPGADARKQRQALYQDSAYQQFVAIGLAAAKEARAKAGKEDEIVFCQVFNYQDFDLVSPRSKGVGALPGSFSMFASWRKLSPTLKQVGVITGPGLEDVINSASLEAARLDIELIHKVVASDKEVLFEYKQMAPGVQGLWLMPDNRVLSGRIIKEMMSYSVRNGKQVVVFNDSLLRLGGLLSLSSSKKEIAEKVVKRLDEAYRGKDVPGPDLLPLEDGDLRINTVVAKRYRLNMSE
jgi:hypothetical protein